MSVHRPFSCKLVTLTRRASTKNLFIMCLLWAGLKTMQDTSPHLFEKPYLELKLISSFEIKVLFALLVWMLAVGKQELLERKPAVMWWNSPKSHWELGVWKCDSPMMPRPSAVVPVLLFGDYRQWNSHYCRHTTKSALTYLSACSSNKNTAAPF